MQFEVKGMKDVEQALLALQAEFGSTMAKRSLVPALRKAVMPARDSIKAAAPIDTGKLKTTVRVGAKVATAKDKKRKYLSANTVAFGYVDVGVKYYDDKGQYRPATEALEFGTAEHPARPFIRRSFKTMIPNMLEILSKDLKNQVDGWAAKQRARR